VRQRSSTCLPFADGSLPPSFRFAGTGSAIIRLSERVHYRLRQGVVYRDSTKLEHSGDQIHKNYNGWIQKLGRDIRKELLYH